MIFFALPCETSSTHLHPRNTIQMTGDKLKDLNQYWPSLRQWLTGWIVCTLIALFLASQSYFNPSVTSHRGEWKQLLIHCFVITYVWGFLTIGIFALTSRIGLDRDRLFRYGFFYLLIGVGFSFVHAMVSRLVFGLSDFSKIGEIFDISLLQWFGSIQSNLILFAVIASGCLAISYYRKYQDRELRASRLEAQLALARLDALKTQLRPHFLFNTLNAISALVRDKPKVAERMLIRLSELLRATLDNHGNEEVTLEDELEFVRRYLEIEQMRFGTRLKIEERVDPDTTLGLVPTLLLQTLVENAMRHGVAKTASPCKVTIVSKKTKGNLQLEVLDTGPGIVDEQTVEEGGGLGFVNTIDRLRHLYGKDHRFEYGNYPSGGFVVLVELPFREGVSQATKLGESA